MVFLKWLVEESFHLGRLLDWGESIRNADSRSQRLLFPPESRVLATVSRHMLEVTKFGVAYAGTCDTGCWTCVIPMLEGGMLHGEVIGKLWDVCKLS